MSKAPPAKWVVTTKTELAEFLRVNRGTIRDWGRRGLPGGTAGPWDMPQVMQWMYSVNGPWWRNSHAQTLLREEQDR